MSKNPEALDVLIAGLDRTGIERFLQSTPTLAVLMDEQGVVKGWNPAFDALHDILPAAALQEALSPAAQKELSQCLQRVARTGNAAPLHLEMGTPAARRRYQCLLVAQSADRILLIGEPVPTEAHPDESLPDRTGELEKLKEELQETRLALEVKQTELAAVLTQTDEVVHTDSLTLLPNRRWIISDLQQQVTYSERYGSPLSISMVDLDNFKDINDTFGHTAGDQVLRFIASEMRDSIRQPDQIGRYGGDEFLVILPNATVNAAAEQATRLCQLIRSTPIIAGNNVIRVELSIGIAQYRPGAENWKTLLDRADQALYQAKNNGRGQWAILES